jgi:hypothetical protein
MSTSKEFQSLAVRKEKECLPELMLTLGSTRLLLVDPHVFWQCTFLKGLISSSYNQDVSYLII